MIDRRDLLIGGACVAALAAAEGLRPRREIKLLGDAKLKDIMPARFGAWQTDTTGGIVVPVTEGSLTDRLYSQLYQQAFTDNSGKPPVMMLIAYGGAQSDQLQLHRPEACYPAVGFAIVARELGSMPIGAAAPLPIVKLTAKQGERIEDIVYWTRLGEDMPQTAGEQRRDRLYAAMKGTVGDGVLVRASAVRADPAVPQHERISRFMADFVGAMAAGGRKALVGTPRANALASMRG